YPHFLHSFPTRRSSDLPAFVHSPFLLEFGPVVCRSRYNNGTCFLREVLVKRCFVLHTGMSIRGDDHGFKSMRSNLLIKMLSNIRSEEHTSELQSREKLV